VLCRAKVYCAALRGLVLWVLRDPSPRLSQLVQDIDRFGVVIALRFAACKHSRLSYPTHTHTLLSLPNLPITRCPDTKESFLPPTSQVPYSVGAMPITSNPLPIVISGRL
jgi:hypothetical protein